MTFNNPVLHLVRVLSDEEKVQLGGENTRWIDVRTFCHTAPLYDAPCREAEVRPFSPGCHFPTENYPGVFSIPPLAELPGANLTNLCPIPKKAATNLTLTALHFEVNSASFAPHDRRSQSQQDSRCYRCQSS
jgi:hypothetical protein